MSLKFAITGGAGFVGSTLALALRENWPDARVIAFDNLHRRGSEFNLPRLHSASIEFVHGDIRNPEDFDALPKVDYLLECSADPSVQAGYDGSPRYVLNTNFAGTINCLEYARRSSCRVIFFSTSRVYPIEPLCRGRSVETEDRFQWLDSQEIPGLSPQGVSEDFPLEGTRSFYGMTKFASEMLLDEYAYAFGLEHVTNRCGVLAGPWQMGKADQGLVSFWVARHVFNKPLKYIGFGGTGKQVRDILHVNDLTRLVIEQITRFDAFKGQKLNVGGGKDRSVSLRELTRLVREATGSTIDIHPDPQTRTADVPLYISDCRKLFERTTWRPRISLEATIKDTADWTTKNANLLATVLG